MLRVLLAFTLNNILRSKINKVMYVGGYHDIFNLTISTFHDNIFIYYYKDNIMGESKEFEINNLYKIKSLKY